MHPWFGQKMPGSCHRFTGFNRHSLRNGFTAYFVLSPATGLCCHRHSSEALAPQELDASNGASGPHDFAVRFGPSTPEASKGFTPFVHVPKRVTTPKRPPHPVSRKMTIMIRPSFEAGRQLKATDLPEKKSENFFARGLDRFSSEGKSPPRTK
jgi:hypothetical protein